MDNELIKLWYTYGLMTAGAILAIYLTARFSLYKSNKYFDEFFDDLKKEIQPTLDRASMLADNVNKEMQGLHESTERLSTIINSIELTSRELRDFYQNY